MSLVDYVGHAAAGAPALSGRQVRLVGFVMAGPRGEPYLARLLIGCCAAGARPVKVGLTGDLPGVLSPGDWVEVVGTYTDRVDPDPVNGEAIPYVSVVSVTVIPAPADPYDS
jgi:putative membrane protein